MPIYEYRCINCQKTFEARQSFKDEPLRVHAQHESSRKPNGTCHGPVERVIPRSSFQLKGSGWAKDGYSSLGNRGQAKG